MPPLKMAATTANQFTTLQQNAAVATCIITDTILRFCYQAILGKSHASQVDHMEAYDKPMFMTWICYSIYSTYILIVLVLLRSQNKSLISFINKEWSGAIGFKKATVWCLGATFLLYAQNYLYVSGIRYIQVSLSTAVSQAGAVFTVALTVLALGRRFSWNEKIGIGLCFLGLVLIVTLSYLHAKEEEDDVEKTIDSNVETLFMGIVTTLSAALCYSFYQIFWQAFEDHRFPMLNPNYVRHTTPILSMADTIFTMSVVGFISLFFGWISVLFFDILEIEVFQLPPKSLVGPLLFTSVLSGFVDSMNGIACVVSSAVIVAMCYPLTIPLSVLIEWIWNDIPIVSWGILGLIGTILVISGVFYLEKDEVDHRDVTSTKSLVSVNPEAPYDGSNREKNVGLSNDQKIV